MKKILFIIHEASATGAPIMINNLLESSYSKRHECFVLSIYGGKIENNLKLNSQIGILHNKTLKNSIYNKLISKLLKSKHDFLKKIDEGFFDLIYINSLATLTRLPSLDFLKNNKVILHIHEGPVLIENLNVEKLLSENIHNFSSIIFVSDFVKKTIVSKYDIDFTKFQTISPVNRNLQDFKSNTTLLDVPINAFVVCSSGSMNYTKGTDVFLQIAKNVIHEAKLDRPIYFVWVGRDGNVDIRNHFFNDIKKMELDSNVIVIPNTDNVINYFYESDVFLLSSREESFSMVAMENAMLGNPVVCFDKGNGANEFINNENGSVVPYLDIQAASDAILEMYNDAELFKKKSVAIKKMTVKYSGDGMAKLIFNVIDAVINGKE
jgi:glycosyltransferase involved in cell wall biosynthesis